jgi:hypothetical protein
MFPSSTGQEYVIQGAETPKGPSGKGTTERITIRHAVEFEKADIKMILKGRRGLL